MFFTLVVLYIYIYIHNNHRQIVVFSSPSCCSRRVGKSMMINAVIGADLLPYAIGNNIFRIYGTNDNNICIRSANEQPVVRLYQLNLLKV